MISELKKSSLSLLIGRARRGSGGVNYNQLAEEKAQECTVDENISIHTELARFPPRMIQGPRSESPKAGVLALSLTSQIVSRKDLYLLRHQLPSL